MLLLPTSEWISMWYLEEALKKDSKAYYSASVIWERNKRVNEEIKKQKGGGVKAFKWSHQHKQPWERNKARGTWDSSGH